MMFDMCIHMNVQYVFYIFGKCLNLSFHNVLHIGMLFCLPEWDHCTWQIILDWIHVCSL